MERAKGGASLSQAQAQNLTFDCNEMYLSFVFLSEKSVGMFEGLGEGGMRQAFAHIRAQSLVEFALVIGLFLGLVMGVVEFAHLLYVYTATANAAAEAARYGATTGTTPDGVPRYRDCEGIQRAALRIGAMAGLRPENIEIFFDRGPGTTPYAACPTPPTTVRGGDRVVVRVTIVYRPLVPLFPRTTLPFTAEVGRTLLGQVRVAP